MRDKYYIDTVLSLVEINITKGKRTCEMHREPIFAVEEAMVERLREPEMSCQRTVKVLDAWMIATVFMSCVTILSILLAAVYLRKM